MPIISFLIKNWKLVFGGLSVLSLVLAFLYVTHSYENKGYEKCRQETLNKTAEGIVNDKQNHTKLEREVTVIDDTALDKRLSRWLRD